MRMLQAVLATCVVLACFAPASATYVAYEGDVFPEQDGWTAGPNGDDPTVYTRSIHDGVFTIDAAADGGATVSYARTLPVTSDRVAYEWRARTSNDYGGSYVDFTIKAGDRWSDMTVAWSADIAYASFLPDTGVPQWQSTEVQLSQGEFHTFRFESLGALYTLYVDDNPVLSATLQSGAGQEVDAQFGFTKIYREEATRAEWDYIRIEDVPEPCALSLGILGGLWATRRRRRIRLLVAFLCVAAYALPATQTQACSGIAVTRNGLTQSDRAAGCSGYNQMPSEVTVTGQVVTFHSSVRDYNGS